MRYGEGSHDTNFGRPPIPYKASKSRIPKVMAFSKRYGAAPQLLENDTTFGILVFLFKLLTLTIIYTPPDTPLTLPGKIHVTHFTHIGIYVVNFTHDTLFIRFLHCFLSYLYEITV